MLDETPKQARASMNADNKAENKTESQKATELVAVSELLPPNLFLIPVSHTTLFPGMVVPLILPEGKLSKTIEFVLEGAGYVGVLLIQNPDEKNVGVGPGAAMAAAMGHTGESNIEYIDTAVAAEKFGQQTLTNEKGERGGFLRYGIAAKVLKKINLPDNQISVLLSGLQRFELKQLASSEPHYVGNVEYLHDNIERGTELEALMRSALQQFKAVSKDNPLISEEVKVALVNVDGPGKLADFMASVLIRDTDVYQDFIATHDVQDRLHKLLVLLKKEQDVQAVQRKIQDDINEKVTEAQREYYLNEQLKSIQKELGRFTDERAKLTDKFKKRLEGKSLKPEVQQRLQEEIDKLQNLHEQSSEYSVSLNYLDWATSLPWGVRTAECHDLGLARRVLEEDHFGLKEVKERILEFLAVKKLKNNSSGTILCLVGPPGTGKTSLGKSIARALNRKFFRFSVGGMRDEAEIKGHRRTYVGAMPGKLIQGLKRMGSQNPVFLIDEIDKMGTGWASGGDPASALLELLDPEQNSEFLDHYLDIPFDCSDVFFITTANTLDSIPRPLLDRMEVIELHGYSDGEKLHITKQYLLPKSLEKNALKRNQIKVSDAAIRYIASRYARESGVRNLEKQLDRISRKVAFKIATGKATHVDIKEPKVVEKFLGAPPFIPETAWKKPSVGVSTGLAWTSHGGEVLMVESVLVPGKGGLVMTGTLGQVMQESANLAYTLVRKQAKRLGLEERFFEKNQLHLHVPSGATPKDGPSAGVTMVASMFSLVGNIPLRPGIAMTGEVTLSGRVLPVGGIKEKLLAAKRSGIFTIVIPAANAKDLKEIDAETKAGLRIIKISKVKDLLTLLFAKERVLKRNTPRKLPAKPVLKTVVPLIRKNGSLVRTPLHS
jgi:ATP-dependent Lon protease